MLCFYPFFGPGIVNRKHAIKLMQTFNKNRLNGLCNSKVELFTLLVQNSIICNLLRQCMLEQLFEFMESFLFADELYFFEIRQS